MAKLHTLPFVQSLAAMQQASEANLKFAGLPRGTLRGTVVDVNDPENRSRCKVVFDDFNPDCPQVSGAGEWSQPRVGGTPDASHWIDVSPAFKGKLPEGLVGKRVNIVASNGQYQYAVLQDVLCDRGVVTNDPPLPNNSTMTRMPCYPKGQLPEACPENIGCTVIELDFRPGTDAMRVCVRVNGVYKWVPE